LSEACGDVSMASEGIGPVFEDGSEIGSGNGWDANDDCIGREIAESLGSEVKEAGESADEIEGRERVDGSEEITENDLSGAETHTVGIDDAEFEDAFAGGLTAPVPFESDVIDDGDEKDTDEKDCRGEFRRDPVKADGQLAEEHPEGEDDEEIETPRECAGEWAGELEGEFNAFPCADGKSLHGLDWGEVDGVMGRRPEKPRNAMTATSWKMPNAAFKP